MELSIKLFIEEQGKYIFGPGRAQLLRAVDALGSLSKASQEQGMSYRWAWGRIKEAEKTLGIKLLMPEAGSGKGNTKSLTAEARELLEWFSSIEEDLQALARKAHGRRPSFLPRSLAADDAALRQPPGARCSR